MISLDELIKGVFLLILSLFGGYMGTTLSCQTQRYLESNMYIKHFLILLVTYFALEFTSQRAPLDSLGAAVLIYSCYLMFARMHIKSTMATFVLLAVAYVISTFIQYYDDDTIKALRLYEIRGVIMLMIIVIILLGFTSYFLEKRMEYSQTWSTKKFIFGQPKCKNN